jgi:carbon starvation protein
MQRARFGEAGDFIEGVTTRAFWNTKQPAGQVANPKTHWGFPSADTSAKGVSHHVKKFLSLLIWLVVALLGAFAYVVMATRRGEPLNSAYILTAALCTYAIGYRFYSKWIAAKVLALEDRRATPCEVHEDGKDFVKTNRFIVFGHHFAAISGPGPLVGPVLAAQFGYLPGSLWIIIGVALGGAVQDFIILAASIRRDGRSLGQMLKDELNSTAGVIGTVAILGIMIVLLAVLALVVVNALAESPWGVFTVAATIPIAMLMGGYLRWVRVGKVLEASVFGVVLLLLAVWGGQFVYQSAHWAPAFTLSGRALAWSIIFYGLAASVLPVWLLLAPRDYLSTFMKLGTIFALAGGCFLVLPNLQMPALTKFVDGSGPIVPGKIFPFCFITIACGAISGFHTLISSGITPKIITRETHARSVGYGAMCLESLVAVMAMIAACTLEPGVYMSMNVKVAGIDAAAVAQATVQQVNGYGAPFSVSADQMRALAEMVQEHTLFGRTGGAATLAMGMAHIFSNVFGKTFVGVWYHFALMFEALFILTTLDAGTRVGRYMIQDALGQVWKPLGDPGNLGANILASALIVAGWGYFLLGGVADPEGGTRALWPIFGIANQLLASIALCLATTVLLKTQLVRRQSPALALVALVPLLWLLSVTVTASYQKIWHESPKIGFIAAAHALDAKAPALEKAVADATADDARTAAKKALTLNRRQHSNALIDAAVTAVFLALVGAIVLLSVREWILLLSAGKDPKLSETDPVWLPAEALVPGKSLPILGMAALGFTLLKEISGEADIDRERMLAQVCVCESPERADASAKPRGRQNVFLTATERKFTGINRCC